MKREIKTISELKSAIQQLEYEQNIQEAVIKKRVFSLAESLKPINMLKGLFNKPASDPEVRESLVNDIIGFATGMLTQKVFRRYKTNNVLKMALEMWLERMVVNKVANNGDSVKSAIHTIINKITGYLAKEKGKTETAL